MKTIGEKIRDRRKELGYSLELLGENVGVTASTVLKYENGSIKIPSNKIEMLAKVLKCSPAYLMGWESEEKMLPRKEENSIISQLTPEELVLLEKFQNMSTVMFMNEGNKISDADKETLAIAYAEVLISQRKKWILWIRKQ